ncbi:imidazole glycerol phosphate synthase subunit HisH [Clostridium fermenticellae]|uniref:Imidazole glycerol phosphate synthase subunit HisH n=1 Tax=Clostridium fermenticellae TaxID=2068654 RepID=A0A386H3C9_9CLOT|nr:imidazole glycerol phosphate synthase subunit HisH [Clostridium fermenticellae]AYD40098.1 imidazole glycerol phosphate synthase subunit HisH [Clostridium fermenticellae]
MIAIIDYGMGNLRSVQKSLQYIGEEAIITSDSSDIINADGIILPGVGAFPDAVENLSRKGLDKIFKEVVKSGKPALGICLGMQLLFSLGEEIRESRGLQLLKGRIKRIYADVKIPHMGWNSINIKKTCEILDGVTEESYVYFVHSFYAEVENTEDLNAVSNYGIEIPAVVSRRNLFGVQFHPEKSGDIGMHILKNFSKLTRL